jgi:hypothetical protein
MAMAIILHPLNVILADPTTPAYAAAGAVVADAASSRAAVDQLGVLRDQPAKVVREADAVFAALPAEVDQGILEVLRAGFARRSPMELHWDEDTSGGEPTVAHRVVEEDGWLHIRLLAPNGQQFV